MANSQASTVVPSVSVSTVPLTRIVIEEGFNPRAEIDPVEQRRLEHSIEQRGIEDGDNLIDAVVANQLLQCNPN